MPAPAAARPLDRLLPGLAVLRRYEPDTSAAAMGAASHAVFVGLLVAAVATVVLLLTVPRRFPTHHVAVVD